MKKFKGLENELINNTEKDNLDLLVCSLDLFRSYKKTFGCKSRVDFWQEYIKPLYILDFDLSEEEFIHNFNVMRNIKDLNLYAETTHLHGLYTDGCNELKDMYVKKDLEKKRK